MFKSFGEVRNITLMTVLTLFKFTKFLFLFYSKAPFLNLNLENSTKVALANVILRYIFSFFVKSRVLVLMVVFTRTLSMKPILKTHYNAIIIRL